MIKIDDSNKKNCCGCCACEAVCPSNAIVIKRDSEGFQYPCVDADKCINCGACDRVCPFLNKANCFDEAQKAYAMYDKNLNNRITSSSGGIFGVLAEYVLKRGGIICGAAFDQKFNVKHIFVETMEDLHHLKGSKYLQSDNERIYPRVKEQLEKGREVLYSGTACQVAGLQKFLGKQYQNLITIDVLCHGVPSPKLWKKYLDEINHNNANGIEGINFRSKIEGWKNFSLEVKYNDGTVKREIYSNNNYMRLFLGNICLRPSCHHCKYKELDRPSDITVGDYWGIEDQLPEMDDDKGVSIVKINTFHGENAVKNILQSMDYKMVDIETALPKWADSRNSVLPHVNRKKFFRRMEKDSMDDLTKLLKESFLQTEKKKADNKLKRVKNKIKKLSSVCK